MNASNVELDSSFINIRSSNVCFNELFYYKLQIISPRFNINMAALSCDEEIIKISIQLLSSLVDSNEKCKDSADGSADNFDSSLRNRLSSPSFSVVYENLSKLIAIPKRTTWPILDSRSQLRWTFLCTLLELMKVIHDVFTNSTDDKVKLLSISQKKILATSLEFVITLGILRNLLPGVGISLDSKSKHIHKVSSENLSEFAKYRRLCQVVDDIFYLFDGDIYHDLIISKHLEDVLAALFQLSFAPIKKPHDDGNEDINFESLNDDFEIKCMTFSVWKKLEEDRKKYHNRLMSLFEKIYKPTLIRKFSVLLDSKNIPRWMKQKLIKFLSDILKEDNGVIITVKALMDCDSTSPALSSHIVSVAKLISHECSSNGERIVPQLLQILKCERRQPQDFIIIQVAVVTINHIYSVNPKFTDVYIFDEVNRPFKMSEFSTEEELCGAVHQLYNLCILPSNNAFTVPIHVLLPSCRILFHMYCRIKDSICYMRSYVKELLSKFLCEIDSSEMATIMNCLIFNSKSDRIHSMPDRKSFSLTDSGGTRLVHSECNLLEMELAVILLDLVKSIPENEKIVRSLFIYLLKVFIDENKGAKFDEKRLIVAILLSDLSQDPRTLRHILKNSEDIIKFVGDLLRVNSESRENDSIICVALTFLTMALYDVKKKRNVRWDVFNLLLPTLEKFKLHPAAEVKLLAEEVCNLIQTRGLIGNIESSPESKKPVIEEIPPSTCERHIEEACDPLLPVRAHALMELISLIKKADPETLAKKEKIYCLFEENLKDQDSFMYLRAIEGLSCMATLKPDVILPLLCQEFTSCTTSATQLKIGEVLIRTTKLLNDFIHSHKKLLVNTFINGAKSEDNLVRASSLSNLAEICLLLESNVDEFLFEILSCALNIAQFDKDTEPRRAAVLLVSQLFRGLKSSIFKVLESHLMEIYLILKRIRSLDKDEVVRVQVSQALNVLNDNTRQFLLPKPTMEKKIHVIRPS